MGSAVDQTNLTRELTRYRDAGYGGVHIIPIYGAKGWESNYIRYLSPRWMEVLDYTVREAKRLDLGVDMTTGSGWCFGGGPYVGENEGNANVVVRTFEVAAGAAFTNKFDARKTQALVAFPNAPPGGERSSAVDLTSKIRPDGSVDWTATAPCRIYAVSQRLNAQKVKRASPGGEGPMLNLIYDDAMPVFLRSFTEAFEKYRGEKPRAQYHDSYEYKSEWAPDFLAQFEKRRGYQLQKDLPAMFDRERGRRGEEAETTDPNRLVTSAATTRASRIRCDYRETVSDIMVEDSLPQWVKWSHARGFITRNEAHGSPGNLLDLYALADVPETEMFRLDRNKLISKFASSAAHVAGRKFTAAETGTWLKEHFTETLADMKYLLDDLFLSGVNHVFYHGTCYSPDEAPWPGWVFYASYEMNPRNAVWHDVRALNDYVARCQAILQSGQPDNDILLYWPIHDFWQNAPAEPLLPHMTVHARAWFESRSIGHVAEQLWQRGFQFDYVSDRQLARAKAGDRGIKVEGGNYQAIVVPPCELMPLATLEKLFALARSGATVIFVDQLPKDVPGLTDLGIRRASFQKLLGELPVKTGEARLAKGRVIIGPGEVALNSAGVAREAMLDHAGLMCIRRSFNGGRHYFIANRGDQPVNGWLPIAFAAQTVVLMDPVTGRTGLAATRRGGTNATEVRLELAAGESVILRAFTAQQFKAPAWEYAQAAGAPVEISGEWSVAFQQGGPTLPAKFSLARPGSWTANPDASAQNFSGTASYSVTFDAPKDVPPTCFLDLGKVAQSARVRLNGRDLGTLFVPPFRVLVDNLKPTGNHLEVAVTSTSANRIRDLDRRGVKWQNFYDINFVNQDYRPFNAANWPVADAGLLGPVTLTSVKELTP
jgi:hypothetical protein